MATFDDIPFGEREKIERWHRELTGYFEVACAVSDRHKRKEAREGIAARMGCRPATVDHKFKRWLSGGRTRDALVNPSSLTKPMRDGYWSPRRDPKGVKLCPPEFDRLFGDFREGRVNRIDGAIQMGCSPNTFYYRYKRWCQINRISHKRSK